jgi:hypothetical protein
MFYIDTKDIPSIEGSTVIVTQKQAIIQYIDDSTSTLTEYDIPLMYCDNDEMKETAFIIDEFILECCKKYRGLGIGSKTLYFEDAITYDFEEGEIMERDTTKQIVRGCFIVSQEIIELLEEDIIIKISIDNNFLKLDDDCGKVLKIKMSLNFGKFTISPQKFNSTYFVEAVKKHYGQFCKIYMENEQPLCLEFNNKRIFIAPIIY